MHGARAILSLSLWAHVSNTRRVCYHLWDPPLQRLQQWTHVPNPHGAVDVGRDQPVGRGVITYTGTHRMVVIVTKLLQVQV